MRKHLLSGFVICIGLVGCQSEQYPIALPGNPNYITRVNATMRKSTEGDRSAIKVQGDEAPEMNESAKHLFPEIANAQKPSPGKEIVAPQAVSLSPPDYPTEYDGYSSKVTVWIAFIIGRDGTVIDVRPLSEPDWRCTKLAVEGVKTWTFRPGKINGEPSEFLATVPIVFEFGKFAMPGSELPPPRTPIYGSPFHP